MDTIIKFMWDLINQSVAEIAALGPSAGPLSKFFTTMLLFLLCAMCILMIASPFFICGIWSRNKELVRLNKSITKQMDLIIHELQTTKEETKDEMEVKADT